METYTKQYSEDYFNKKKQYFFGLDLEQGYNKELTALKRVQNRPGMQQLIAYDELNLTITTAWAGYPLNYIFKHAHKTSATYTRSSFVDQLNDITLCLDNIGITHLDLLPKNICLLNGKLTVIDFGICVLDHRPETQELAVVYQKFIEDGGYQSAVQRVVDKVN